MSYIQVQNLPDLMMAQQPIYTRRGNLDSSNFNHIFSPPEPFNTVHSTIEEGYKSIQHSLSPVLDPVPIARHKRVTSRRRTSKNKVSLESRTSKVLLAPKSQDSSRNMAGQPSSDEVPLGPRGGRKGRPVHHCSRCNKTYTRKEHLDRHESKHSPNLQFFCEVCKQILSRDDTFKNHLVTRRHMNNTLKASSQAPAPFVAPYSAPVSSTTNTEMPTGFDEQPFPTSGHNHPYMNPTNSQQMLHPPLVLMNIPVAQAMASHSQYPPVSEFTHYDSTGSYRPPQAEIWTAQPHYSNPRSQMTMPPHILQSGPLSAPLLSTESLPTVEVVGRTAESAPASANRAAFENETGRYPKHNQEVKKTMRR